MKPRPVSETEMTDSAILAHRNEGALDGDPEEAQHANALDPEMLGALADTRDAGATAMTETAGNSACETVITVMRLCRMDEP